MFELFMFLLYDFDHFLFLKIFLYFYMGLYTFLMYIVPLFQIFV